METKDASTEIAAEDATLTEGQFWIWDMFDRVARTRGFTEGGPQSLTYAELQSFFDMHGVSDDVRPEIADILTRMDVVWIKHSRATLKAQMDRAVEEKKQELSSRKAK